MTENTEDKLVIVGEEELSLAAIAGIDMEQVAEVRFSNTPEGLFHWKIQDAELTVQEVEDKENPGSKINKPVVKIMLEAVNCLALNDDTLDPANYVGRKHSLSFWINSAEDIGKAKAFLVDIGMEGSGVFGQLLTNSIGEEFVSQIKHVANRNDADRPYVNVVKIQTIKDFSESQAA